MADDPFVRWRQSVPFAIYVDGKWDQATEGPWSAWHAGRVKDILRFPDGSVLIAAEHGGLWRTQADGQSAICVTDGITAHQFNRLAFGPDGDDHVFAGGESLWVTDPSAALPMLTWQQITSFNHGTVWDILVLDRTIVVAAEGIWWADIPTAQPKPGCLGALLGGPSPAAALYTWKQALIDTPSGRVPTGAFYSVAEGRPDRRNANRGRYRTVIAGSAGVADQQGIFLGRWNATGDLAFDSAARIFVNSNDATALFQGTGDIAVSSCIWDTDRAYAAADRNDKLDLLLRSTDGGRSWTPCGSGVPLDTKTLDLFAKCDHQAGHQTLHVYPANADVVGFGWFDSYVSFDAGDSWEAPGCDDSFLYHDNHQHVDVHRVVLPPPPDVAGVTPARSLLVGSDGATNRITWGQGASLIEGQFKTDGKHGDLEAVILEGNNLIHYRRPSNTLEWVRFDTVTSKATDRACMIQGDFGVSKVKNFELVVPEGDDLVHYFRNNSGGGWQRAQVVASGITGAACMIQSNYPKGADHGNFEVVVLEGADLVHYWHDNGNVANPWQRGPTITSHAASSACMIQSDYPKGADHGNFEVVVLEDEGGVFGRALVHYWRDNGGNLAWNGPVLITKDATAAAWLIQADYTRGADHHNFELFVQQGLDLWHWIRNNQANGNPWMRIAQINGPNEKIDGAPVALQGNYGSDDHHGNFELLASFGGRVFHYWRDAADPNLAWHRSVQLSRYAYHYFTGWNRNTPTLMCKRFTDTDIGHGQLGVSQALDGMIAVGTQDNGVIAAITDPFSTPWVQLGGGDGNEAVWPASTSPSFNQLHGGNLLVWTHDDEGGAPHGSVGDPNVGMKGAIPEILPLEVPDPTVAPLPDPALGLVGDPRIARVISPAYVVDNLALSLVAAPAVAKGVTRAPIYGLFIDGPFLPPRARPQPIKAGWRFLAAADVAAPTATRDWPIRAMASLDGSTVMLAASVRANARSMVDHTELLLLDVGSGSVTVMDTDPTLGYPTINWIVPVARHEAYSATGDGRVLVWDGKQWRFPGSVVASGASLEGMAVDAATSPATVFVITADTVYVSRDGTRTWRTAMRGLPRSLECANIHLMIDHQQMSRLHLSTYGRSTWVADRVEPG
ncbi:MULTISPECIES: hypothetical protein [unclassified Paraburkholderia]|uniref:hypothetical protein n=1 Tax=unclassified Paraburkholderia TaxID=2615204 RepID=UPI00160CFE9F|nr:MULTISPECIES: hypothetical protein [unclassified Paraburkholderia]MBB5448050.1 hypothetical protein [Paraburkholderia sp. WSM4177]MBB5488465.1 hypothetical protein [Paraburkholderia sp. WSM4180]